MPDLLLKDCNIDWDELRAQKQTIGDIVAFSDDYKHTQHCEAIFNLLSYLQDEAVESGIWSEEEIFGADKDDQYFEFSERYTPVKNHICYNAPYDGCMFETYGEELTHVQSVCVSTPNNVWTIVEGDEGRYIVAGYHRVNRIGYLVTEIPWETGEEEFYDE